MTKRGDNLFFTIVEQCANNSFDFHFEGIVSDFLGIQLI